MNAKKNIKNLKIKGFTLIEVLVVIGIISMLIATAAVSYSVLSRNSRDAKRKTDIEQIRAALEIYKSNSSVSQYPGFFGGNVWGWTTIDNVNPAFLPYINSIPQDPKPSASCGNYLYAVPSNYYGYTIFTNLENTSAREVTTAKPTPRAGSFSSSDGYKTLSITSGSCQTTFNYWINSP